MPSIASRIQVSQEVNNLKKSSLGPLQSPCKCPLHTSKNSCYDLQDSFNKDEDLTCANKEERDYKPSGKVKIPQGTIYVDEDAEVGDSVYDFNVYKNHFFAKFTRLIIRTLM